MGEMNLKIEILYKNLIIASIEKSLILLVNKVINNV